MHAQSDIASLINGRGWQGFAADLLQMKKQLHQEGHVFWAVAASNEMHC